MTPGEKKAREPRSNRKSRSQKTVSSKKRGPILAYDLGGTKIQVGVVDRTDQILESQRESVESARGKAAVFSQLIRLGRIYLNKYKNVDFAGIASAGPLDPASGVLMDPTNLTTQGKSWGVVPIAEELRKKLKVPVTLENDAAAAIMAEHWVGEARGIQNAMILTLGTGVGVGVLSNGQLVRAGRWLHPEASHITLNAEDRTAPCGCGNFGCVEAYLSAKNFAKRASAVFFKNREVGARELVILAEQKDPTALEAFEDYARWMALAIQSYVVLFAPERVIFAGSFAVATKLFLKPMQKHLQVLLKRRRKGIDLLPDFRVSRLQNSSGLVGAAHTALLRNSVTS